MGPVSASGTSTQTQVGECAAQHAVAQHLGLVYHVARGLARTRRIDLELDELVSAGTLGLIEAVANFDASRGLSFTTFATPRIRGAILDELRRLDHVPRSVRRRARAVTAATDALANEQRRAGREGRTTPDETLLASRLGIDRETLWRWRRDGEAAHRVPFERAHTDANAAWPSHETLCAQDACDVDDVLTQEQELAALANSIRALGPRERTVLTLYYYEELRLHQIAEILGVTESRVSQICKQAIARLRDQLAHLRDVAAPCHPSHPAPARVRQRRLPRGGAPR
jgi:RNA polymerase sigma factor for flagellar operon FliA